jgi:8-oxo-dGTP pyrophosphatase MutT (NUDIX family)
MGYSGAILTNSQNQILFQLRDEKGRNPNKWGIFGGGIKKNEKPISAVIRELKEELGLVVPKEKILYECNFRLINYHIFRINLEKIPKKSNLKEGKAMKFMTKKEFFKNPNALWRVKMFLRFFKLNHPLQ